MRLKVFLEIENALSQEIGKAWHKALIKRKKQIYEAVNDEDFFSASNIIRQISIKNDLVRKRTEYERLLMAAVNFGATVAMQEDESAKTVPIAKRAMIRNPLKLLFNSAIEGIPEQAAKAPKTLQNLTKSEFEIVRKEGLFDLDMITEKIENNGIVVAKLSSNQVTSRLSAFGALTRLLAEKKSTYVLRAILDHRTTEICQRIDGTIRYTTEGLSHIREMLRNTDREKIIAEDPWIDRKQVDLIRMLGKKVLRNNPNYSQTLTPPFHGFCRTICIEKETDRRHQQVKYVKPNEVELEDPEFKEEYEKAKELIPDDWADSEKHDEILDKTYAGFNKAKKEILDAAHKVQTS